MTDHLLLITLFQLLSLHTPNPKPSQTSTFPILCRFARAETGVDDRRAVYDARKVTQHGGEKEDVGRHAGDGVEVGVRRVEGKGG